MDNAALALTIHYIQHALQPKPAIYPSPAAVAVYCDPPATIEHCLTCEKFMALKGAPAEIINIPNPLALERKLGDEKRKQYEQQRKIEDERRKYNEESKYNIAGLYYD